MREYLVFKTGIILVTTNTVSIFVRCCLVSFKFNNKLYFKHMQVST